jgi:hypothetical protein
VSRWVPRVRLALAQRPPAERPAVQGRPWGPSRGLGDPPRFGPSERGPSPATARWAAASGIGRQARLTPQIRRGVGQERSLTLAVVSSCWIASP